MHLCTGADTKTGVTQAASFVALQLKVVPKDDVVLNTAAHHASKAFATLGMVLAIAIWYK